MQLDSFTKQYIATALWSSSDSNDQPLYKNYDANDLSDSALQRIVQDCQAFQEQAAGQVDANGVGLMTPDNLLRAYASDGDWLGSFGHDFWLTRNGHGAGFWDGDYSEPAATVLTELSKTFGESYLYVGDDGKLYAS